MAGGAEPFQPGAGMRRPRLLDHLLVDGVPAAEELAMAEVEVQVAEMRGGNLTEEANDGESPS